jgi:hypothetical protein
MEQVSLFVGVFSIYLLMAVEEAASLMSIMAMASYGRQVFHFLLFAWGRDLKMNSRTILIF